MAKKHSTTGHWAFILGILLAIIAGLIPQLQTSTITWILVLLGLIVGFLNVTISETQEFLIAAIALLLISSTGALPVLGTVIAVMLSNIVAFVAPAALIVALKAVYDMASN
jgi:hypothetical protein